MKIKFFDIKLDSLTKAEADAEFLRLLTEKKSSSLVTTVNMEFVDIVERDHEFKRVLNERSSLNFVDGTGIILNYGLINAWRPQTIILKQAYVVLQWLIAYLFFPFTIAIYRKFIPTTVSGSDFIYDIANIAAKHNLRVFLLGYSKGLDPNVVEKVSLKLQTDIYNLRIVGVHSGTDSVIEEEEITSLIKKSDADILLASFGSPRQEKWLERNLKKTGCKIGIGLGGTFDFIAGVQKRAPRWMRQLGLEWFYRLILNPKRIIRQMALFRVAIRVLAARLK